GDRVQGEARLDDREAVMIGRPPTATSTPLSMRAASESRRATIAFTRVGPALLFGSTSPITAIMHPMLRTSLALCLIAAPLAAQQPPADLIVTNARIYTVDDSRPFVEALAVRGGRVAFAGDARAALTLKGPQTRVLDLGGRTVIPGMVDAHGHVAGLGSSLAIVDLTGASSYDEIIARVAARAKTVAPGVWVTGRGWDQNRWADTRFPSHLQLTAAVPDNPVLLERVDGHANLANRKAMDAAGVTAAT